jgi:hypothetical protein
MDDGYKVEISGYNMMETDANDEGSGSDYAEDYSNQGDGG